MKYIFILVSFFTLCLHAQQAPPVISREELIADIRYCRDFHEKHNTNLYAYRSKAFMDSLFDALEKNVEPMDGISFFRYMSAVTSSISDGHCLLFPSEEFRTSSDTMHGFFPFRIHYNNGAFYVTMNLSDNANAFSNGMPINSINGISADSIYHAALRSLPREGNNLQYPNWIIEKYFYEYYSYIYGHPETFELGVPCKTNQGISDDCVSIEIPAVTKDTLVARRKRRYPDYPMTVARDNGISFTRFDSLDAAMLSLFTWDKTILRNVYGIHFKDSIDTYMETAINDSIGTLIIDLRNNQGGFMLYGVYVMRWLMDSTFNYLDKLERCQVRRNGERRYRSVNAARFTSIKPFKKRYTGKVIILTNGGSFSNSSIFTSQMQRCGRAVVMGEETGGSATQLTGSFGIHKPLVMPNTKIEIAHINYRIILNQDIPYSGTGVIPDVAIDDEWDPENGDIFIHKVLHDHLQK